MQQEFCSASEAETEKIGAQIARLCRPGDFIAMYGDMGSGKTVFMRGFVSVLVPQARVSSPTYAILNVYDNGECCVNHFDLYRIGSSEDLYSTGFDEVIRKGITVCEWSENIPDDLPKDHIKLIFEKLDDTTRRIRLIRGAE